MSSDSKIRAYRELKRIASENRHLYARLLSNIESQHSSRRVVSSFSGADADRISQKRKYLLSGRVGGPGTLFQTSVCVPFHHRCRLNVAESSAASQQEAELGAIVDALAIASSSTEWKRITRVFDSDLFVSFLTLLTALNAYALVRLTRSQPARGESAPRHPPLLLEGRPQFRATVAVDLPSIDDAAADLGTRRCEEASGTVPLEGIDADFCSQSFHHTHHSRQYDVGVTGDWAPCARDAIKMVLFKSLDVLQTHAVEEWRDAGREGALLLNELAWGGCCTSEMDVRVLNSYLCQEDVVGISSCVAAPEDQLLRFRCVASYRSASVTVTSAKRRSNGTQIKLTCVPEGVTRFQGLFADSNPVAPSPQPSAGPAMADEISFPFPIAAVCIRRPFVDIGSWKAQPKFKELLWPRQCMAGASLLLLASMKASLYRNPISTSTALLQDEASVPSVPRRSPGVSEIEWRCVPFFSTLCSPAYLQRGLFSLEESLEAGLSFTHNPTNLSAQNDWHYPDVVAMIGSMRAALHLPLRSYPKITFEQTALHAPARRVQELSRGAYGDVDILTRVHVCWETPRGCFTACAVSEPDLHHQNAFRCDATESSRSWLSCADTGYPRGPLPLLIAAVCSLYDQVFGSVSNGVEGRYPVVPLKDSHERRELDFILYSWFEASPQLRCFTISTASPSSAEQSISESTAILDGTTRVELGGWMTRAMLFYDILGQRVLFAETHATRPVDAVGRVRVLAEEQNCRINDMYASPSLVAQRAFRCVSQQQQWQLARDRLERCLRLRVAAADVTGTGGMPIASMCLEKRQHHRSVVAPLVRACIGACASEACALWTMLDVLARLATSCAPAGSESNIIEACKGLRVRRPLCASFLTDLALADDSSAGETGCGADRGWWFDIDDATWNRQALGKEAPPPRAGVMEMRLCIDNVGESVSATANTQETAAVTVESVILRCRVDPSSRVREVTEAEWLSEELVRESPSLECFTTVVLTTTLVTSGCIPALALLCRRALAYIYSEARFAPLLSILPPMGDVLAWCRSCAPIFDGAGCGYPPYDARFYAAPKLLGELLQGVAGKYRCRYHVASPADPLMSAASGAGGAGRFSNAANGEGAAAMASVQPSTIFYTSEPIDVDKGVIEVATRRQCGSCLAELPVVACTLYLESLFGDAMPSSVLSISLTCPAAMTAPFVLGHGVGRTKREAWRSAAWQALRLQFPAVLAHLEAYRDVSRLLQCPKLMDRLVRRSGLDRNGTRGGVAPVVYKLDFRCSQFSHGCMNNTAAGAASTAPRQAPLLSRCQVTAVRTDDSKVCIVPGSATTAASPGEAYAAAVSVVLRGVRGDGQWSAMGEAKATMNTPPDHVAWSAGMWPSTSCSLDNSTGSRSSGPYASWRETTHYAKSVWHAYAGALGAYLDEDVVIHLVGAEDPRVDHREELSRMLGGKGKDQCRVMLSGVQVRMRNWRVGAAAAADDLASRFTDQTFAAPDESIPSGDSAVFVRSLGRREGCAAEGILFEHTASSLLARSPSLPGISSPRMQIATIATATTAASSPPPLPPPLGEHPLRLLQEITRWLRSITQQCVLSLGVHEELQGLLCARASDAARIQASYRWSHGERVEALLASWVGRRAQVRIRRVSHCPSASLSAANQTVWVAEAFVGVERRFAGQQSSPHVSFSSDSNRQTQQEEHDALEWQANVMRYSEYPWVAARAVGGTSEEAAWGLYRYVCDAFRDVVAREPHSSPSSTEKGHSP